MWFFFKIHLILLNLIIIKFKISHKNRRYDNLLCINLTHEKLKVVKKII